MPDTPYTQGFKAGMAWKEKEQMAKRSFLEEAIYQAKLKEQDRVVTLLEEKVASLSKIETGHGYGSELMSIRIKTIESIIDLIRGEK